MGTVWDEDDCCGDKVGMGTKSENLGDGVLMGTTTKGMDGEGDVSVSPCSSLMHRP